MHSSCLSEKGISVGSTHHSAITWLKLLSQRIAVFSQYKATNDDETARLTSGVFGFKDYPRSID